ncbi:MAG: hypothetical protein CL792_03415 [Chloroflexi bacterium]|nr:hypothetical protein [Chloroflexota bacterium]|tara:strand:- start:33245 stop:33706 length:462 start_codon:yes stop_codon:yes gene_type:complete
MTNDNIISATIPNDIQNYLNNFIDTRINLIQLLEKLPETRLSSRTKRDGWTLRHQLSWIFALDSELNARLSIASGKMSIQQNWRRIRGEAMHKIQPLRLSEITTNLESSGKSIFDLMNDNEQYLSESMVVDVLKIHMRDSQELKSHLENILSN